jgi:hypothetical protein
MEKIQAVAGNGLLDPAPISAQRWRGEREVMNAQTLAGVRMSNRDGFIPRFPDKT